MMPNRDTTQAHTTHPEVALGSREHLVFIASWNLRGSKDHFYRPD